VSKIIILLFIFLSSYKFGKFITDDYANIFNKNNKYYKLIVPLINFASILLVFSILLFIFDVLFFSLNINILNISAIGILIAVLLTITHNFYLKEEEILKEEKFKKYHFDNTITKMINKISFEIKRLDEESDNYNQNNDDTTIQNLDFLTIKNSLHDDIKMLYLNGINITKIQVLNDIDTKYLAILDLSKYRQTNLLKNYNKNIRVLRDILTMLQKIDKKDR